jgi:hypothetical protein
MIDLSSLLGLAREVEIQIASPGYDVHEMTRLCS